jgi:molecular chaperone GrpE
MSECPPSDVIENAPVHGPQALTPEAIEAILADFREWLQQPAVAPAPEVSGPPAEPIDLHTLLGQFVALRHEVNLQTKAARGQQEQNAEALRQLGEALEALQQAQGAADALEEEAADEHLRPLLKTLVDLADALGLAQREVQKVRAAVEPALEQLVASAPPGSAPPAPPAVQPIEPVPVSSWARWLGLGETVRKSLADYWTKVEALGKSYIAQHQRQLEEQQERQVHAGRAAERVRHLLDSVLTGYAMSVQRVERALQQHGLEVLTCEGEPFDPERMEVVEVVADSGRPSGEVVDVIRRGYLWHGRVFRYAQVRVAKS